MTCLLKFMQKTILYPASDSKKNEIVRDNKLLHVRMNAVARWVSIDDALGYLWPKVYDGDQYAYPCKLLGKHWESKLPRAVYIKACWPPTGKDKEEFLAIHLDNLHLLFDASQ